jgi:glycosyltransferase involved in cell wall biosynthesis
MRIEVVIPTKNREIKLLKCLGSIVEAKQKVDYNFFTYVYFSDEKEYYFIDKLLSKYTWILTRYEKEYNASSFWNNHIKQSNADIIFYLNDDVILSPDCLINSIDSMEKNFPDFDGVIGLYQENIPINQQCKAAFGAIGKKFTERFPNKKVFCEEYNRFFLDQELYEYSSKIGKHFFDENARLIHCHPVFDKKYEDSTHLDVRKYLTKDKKKHNERVEKGLLWGENFK